MARTAVIAGTATHVSNNVSRRQAERWAADNPQPEAAPAPASQDAYTQLAQLSQLKDQGVITQADFDAKKAQLLGL
jgi:hypothetical protein